MKNKTKPSGNNNWSKHLLCLTLAVVATAINAQNYKKDFDKNKIYHHFHLADSAYRYEFIVLAPADIKPEMDKSYTWYFNNAINTTQGNYSGKLLHGIYVQSFLNSKQMAVKGEYKEGLKTGKWHEWRKNGSLISVVEYKKGIKQGDAFYYDAAGNITEKCRFKKNQKTGKSIIYIDGVKQKTNIEKKVTEKKEKQKKQKPLIEKEAKEKKPVRNKSKEVKEKQKPVKDKKAKNKKNDKDKKETKKPS